MNETIHSQSSTATTDPAAAGDRFGRVLDALIDALADQVLASQDRCVDALLDLYNVAPGPLARQLVVDMLDEIRHLRAVKAEWLLAQLADLGAAVAVEEAFFA
ncbi:MAG: hypothetical protein ACFCVK_13215 [Acidimicrobiales bacterium]